MGPGESRKPNLIQDAQPVLALRQVHRRSNTTGKGLATHQITLLWVKLYHLSGAAPSWVPPPDWAELILLLV